MCFRLAYFLPRGRGRGCSVERIGSSLQVLPSYVSPGFYLLQGMLLSFSVWLLHQISSLFFCLYLTPITPDDPLVPVHLLIYAVQTAMTTLTCIVDYMSWNVEVKVKMDLGALYGPYLLVCELFRPCDRIKAWWKQGKRKS